MEELEMEIRLGRRGGSRRPSLLCVVAMSVLVKYGFFSQPSYASIEQY
jgi:hypothetical protein